MIDIATAIFAITTLLLIKIPDLTSHNPQKKEKTTSSQEMKQAWQYLKKRPGLLGISCFFFIKNYLIGLTFVLFTPFVLSFTSTTQLGLLILASGMGMVAGGALMSIWGGPKRLIYCLYFVEILSALIFLLSFLPPSIPRLAFGGFFIYFMMGVSSSCSQAIWQKKIVLNIQGRVFALRRMIALSSMPIAFLTAGPLADYIFEPLMAVNGPCAGNLGQLFGTGHGRGIALLFSLIGVIMIIVTSIAIMYPRMRFIETELPDAVTE